MIFMWLWDTFFTIAQTSLDWFCSYSSIRCYFGLMHIWTDAQYKLCTKLVSISLLYIILVVTEVCGQYLRSVLNVINKCTLKYKLSISFLLYWNICHYLKLLFWSIKLYILQMLWPFNVSWFGIWHAMPWATSAFLWFILFNYLIFALI